MTGQRAKTLLIALFVLWMFFVLGSFFAVQKPFVTANVVALGNAALNVLVAVWLTLIAVGLGGWLWQPLQPTGSAAEMIVLGAGLGFGMVGILSFALGLAGLFYPVVVYAVTVVLTLLAVPPLVRLFGQWRNRHLEESPGILPLLYLVIFAIFTLLVALLPPNDWDGLFYHLTGPKLYLQAGGIIGGIDIPHLSFPALMEMIFAWAMLLRGDIAAKLVHSVFGLLLAGLIYLIAHRFMGRKAIWPALLVLAGMPMVNMLAGWAYNDLALAFYQLAALYCYLRWAATTNAENNASPPAWLIFGGVFAGLAMGLKYTSFITPLVIAGLIAWSSYRQSRAARNILRNLITFALPALLVALPWYIKNWIFTGNPVYPFLYPIFGGLYWDEFRAQWYAAAGTGIGWRPGTLLTLPWLLTLGIRDMNYWDGRTGPLLLLFLPLIIWAAFSRRANKPAAVGALLIFALVQYLFWALGVIWTRGLWQSRLLLSGLVALVPVAGWLWAGLADMKVRHFSLGRFVNIAVGLTLALILIDIGLLTLKIDPLPYLVGLESRETYLTRRLGAHYAAMEQINDDLPAEAVVQFLWEPRSYYCRHDCRPDSILDTFPHLVYQYDSAEAIAQVWRQAGITHILIHRSGLEFVLNESPELVDTAVLNDLESGYLHLLFDVGGAYQVYELKD